MLFNSIEFFIFFPLVTAAYFLIPHRYRWLLLLVASCYFYMAFVPIYILILFFTISVDYIAGILIEQAAGNKRKIFLQLSILANLGVLAIFKYSNFINANISLLYSALGLNYPVHDFSFILPIGLSFHTFQSLSYTIEVYRGHVKAERHLGIFALYVMFYPQLVAGPIERPQNLLHQFHAEHSFDYEKAASGLKLMMWGLFKKVVIADRFAVIVNQVFNKPHDYEGPYLMVATFLFAFQIYCDFSGYSDIARGSARVMGFELMKNFDSPYLARSISEFWKRWHISLSTWFRDYLYIPLGGNRVSKPRWYLNLFFTFLVSGLWHGANWTFIIWGCLHGLYLVGGLLLGNTAKNIQKMPIFNYFSRVGPLVQTFTTFLLVSFAWIFFRANTLSDAIYITVNMFRGYSHIFGAPSAALEKIDLIGALPGFIGLLIMGGVELMARNNDISKTMARQTAAVRWAVYYALILFTLIFGVYDTSQFIYFQF